jgi:Leucine-rich repeat (LRR) protein
MTSLHLGSNPIQDFQPGSLPLQLESFSLGFAGITELHPEIFFNLTQLRDLHLYYNPITELPPGLFSHLESLRTLNIYFTNIQRLNSNSFNRLENLNTFSIRSSGLDEIQPGFFDNFPNLDTFNASNNTCVNATLRQPHQIDFEENAILHQCFANWYVPRETTTPSGSERKVENVIFLISAALIQFLIK